MSPISERAARHHLVKAAEAMVVRVGAKSFVHALTLKQLTAAMAGVPIDHGGNNPRNKQVLQKRFIEVLCELGPKEYARRFVRSVDVMAMLCRESQTDEACLDEVLTLACTDLEMDDGGYATAAELEAHKLEELQALLEESLHRVGVQNYLMGFGSPLLRRVCRNLGIEPQHKESRAAVLIGLIMARLEAIRLGGEQYTAGGTASDHQRDRRSPLKAKPKGKQASAKKKDKVVVLDEESVEEEEDEDDEVVEVRAKKRRTPGGAKEKGGKRRTIEDRERPAKKKGKKKAEKRKSKSEGEGEDEDGSWNDEEEEEEEEADEERETPTKKKSARLSRTPRTRKRKSCKDEADDSDDNEEEEEEIEKRKKQHARKKTRRDSRPAKHHASNQQGAEEEDEDIEEFKTPPRRTGSEKATRTTARIAHNDGGDAKRGPGDEDDGARCAAKQPSEAEEMAPAAKGESAKVTEDNDNGDDGGDEDDDGGSTQRFFQKLQRGASKMLASPMPPESRRASERSPSPSSSSSSSEESDDSKSASGHQRRGELEPTTPERSPAVYLVGRGDEQSSSTTRPVHRSPGGETRLSDRGTSTNAATHDATCKVLDEAYAGDDPLLEPCKKDADEDKDEDCDSEDFEEKEW